MGENIDWSKADRINQYTAKFMQQSVENGIPVVKVADDVFKAIAEDRFYILTHQKIKPLIHTRMEDILQERLPTLAGM